MIRRRLITWFLVAGLLGIVTFIVVVVLTTPTEETTQPAGYRLAVMTLALAVAIPLHVRLPSGLDASPVAPSIALAMAFAPMVKPIDCELTSAVGLTGIMLGTVCGLGISRLLRQPPTSFQRVAIRIVSCAVAMFLYRLAPIFHDQSAADVAPSWADHPWRIALAMTACAAVALALDLALTVLWVAPRGRIRATGEMYVSQVGPIWLAVMGISVAIALGFGPLDLWSVPVMVAPLLLLRTALRRQAAIVQVRQDTVHALADLTDLTGYTRTDHSRRVHALCTRVGQQLFLTEQQMQDLENAALLHDVGQLGLTHPIPDGATSEAAPADQLAIAAAGAAVVREIGTLQSAAVIIAEQTTPFRNVRELGQDVPIEARILKVCNAYDDLTGGRPNLRAQAIERISLGMGYQYDPDVVDLLTNLTDPGNGADPYLPRHGGG